MQWTRELNEAGSRRLAELLALKMRPGDLITLSGELGTGKTTLARALITASLGSRDAEVPSPTFSLHQTYATPRLTIAHFDFYRLSNVEEARELGFEEALADGAAIVEWPERASTLLPPNRFEIVFAESADPNMRLVTVRGMGTAADRVARIGDVMAFLDAESAWADARIAYLQGDASTRSYARLFQDGRTVLLMDALRQPDGPPIREGKSYSRIARLAEDMVRPFVAIGAALRGAGLSAPGVLGADLDKGLLLVEDLGDRLFGREMAAGTSQSMLWRTAVDTLVHLRRAGLPTDLPLPDGTRYRLPRRDRAAFEIEIDLLLDWLWPELKGGPIPDAVRTEFQAVWQPVLDRLLALPGGWFLRDYHSPNLLWLPEREGVARVGILDFQDALNEHFAFDLVSLLQDARVDVPEALERELFDYYCEQVAAQVTDFDRARFTEAYADFGAQRNTRLLGLWARLLRRDGKPHYLQHVPRTWGYLARNLRPSSQNATLAPLAEWYEIHFPHSVRSRDISP
jgi:tRNA threonylcarbamoyl adenosine modification protein YjeE